MIKDKGKFRLKERTHSLIEGHIVNMVANDDNSEFGRKHFCIPGSQTKEYDKHLRTFEHHLQETLFS